MDFTWDSKYLELSPALLLRLPETSRRTLAEGSISDCLEVLANLGLEPRWTVDICSTFHPLLVEICTRWFRDPTFQPNVLRIAAALARILPYLPHLALYAEKAISALVQGPYSPVATIQRLLFEALSEDDLIETLLTLNRVIEYDDQIYIVEGIKLAHLQLFLSHRLPSVRYLTARLICACTRGSDALFNQMLTRYLPDLQALGPWEGSTIDYMFYPLWESKRLANLKNVLGSSTSTAGFSIKDTYPCRPILPSDLSQNTVSVAGVLMPSLQSLPGLSSRLLMSGIPLENTHKLAQAVRDNQAVLVTGATSSGKTESIIELARLMGKVDKMLTLHLNDQSDAKQLIGLHTSAGTPGAFRWQAGVLTTAVTEGRWILVEDLDRAPQGIQTLLKPLAEHGHIYVPNLGGLVRSASGFKMLATIRTQDDATGVSGISRRSDLISKHFHHVHFTPLTDRDLSMIIALRYPQIQAHQQMVLTMYRKLQHLVAVQMSVYRTSSYGHIIGLTSLLRYCSRLQHMLNRSGANNELASTSINDVTYDIMFLEAIDCFSSSFKPGPLRTAINDVIAQTMQLPPARVAFCMDTRLPSYLVKATSLSIGRVNLVRRRDHHRLSESRISAKGRPFALTASTLRSMESIAAAVTMTEPCLLIGETGTGKTTVIQELAAALGYRLIVVNLSQQSEVSDLLGGFKPLSTRTLALPLLEVFNSLLSDTFGAAKNHDFTKNLNRAVARNDWKRVARLWQGATSKIESVLQPWEMPETPLDYSKPQKKRKTLSKRGPDLIARWADFRIKLITLSKTIEAGSKGFAFSFVEGKLVEAVRNGAWVLLDEINMASPDVLETLAELFTIHNETAPYVLLSESGNIEKIHAHPGFRIFGAMNPSNDVGKHDLVPNVRARFTEHYFESPDKNFESLQLIVQTYLGDLGHGDPQIAGDTTRLYLSVKELEGKNSLTDGAGQNPHFSLRTLTRALVYAVDFSPSFGLRRAFYEGFVMSFMTLLSSQSILVMEALLHKHIFRNEKQRRAILNQPPKMPEDGRAYIKFKHLWMRQGSGIPESQDHYIITPSVERNLLNLVRAASTRRYPILLQGPTSSGKTSMIEYLAKKSGRKCVRINNHEHTDLQEYLGNYVSDTNGQLRYEDGVLVQALRKGFWIILDELNLAPSDVLEALNRLLDDNRELFVPETQEIIKPHDDFILFSTQNPPGLYGGRKVLSRAFRNRFLELHFEDIPEDELEIILRERTRIAPSFVSRIVQTYKQLALLRQTERLFEQNNSFATLRDLFRWASRDAPDREKLAYDGFMILAERVRNSEERVAVKSVIERTMRINCSEDWLYTEKVPIITESLQGIDLVWTRSVRRLFLLITEAFKRNEPVLLVGETGCGKTSICQVIARYLGRPLRTVNAHQSTETGDLIGAQRPLRNRSSAKADLKRDLTTIATDYVRTEEVLPGDLDELLLWYENAESGVKAAIPEQLKQNIQRNAIKVKALFEWNDGSLIEAMKSGHYFLLDEISLADDAVLERLNSVLEPARSIVLAEKGDDTVVYAAEGFQFIATMNPGGDYGKRELSPALRNRFTEIWVPSLGIEEDVFQIVEHKLSSDVSRFAMGMVRFAAWYAYEYQESLASPDLRSLLAWVAFVNRFSLEDVKWSLPHGAAMTFIDSIGANPAGKLSNAGANVEEERRRCLEKLEELVGFPCHGVYDLKVTCQIYPDSISFGPFAYPRTDDAISDNKFSLDAPTTASNTMRVLRGLQLRKPLLLEGKPGVGKTSLVSALAQALGISLVRINLSDQTDLIDLFGTDVPVEGADAGHFVWCDAPFLQAMQDGHWVLLDEMNLASQGVLEGLNAVLDHRGEVFIPELGKTFLCHPDFRIFAAQNSHHHGGGRKGLPSSFVSRFTVVYADELTATDLMIICQRNFPQAPNEIVDKLINFVQALKDRLGYISHSLFADAIEINLRDVLRWLHLLYGERTVLKRQPGYFANMLFLQRARAANEIEIIRKAITDYFGLTALDFSSYFGLMNHGWQIGMATLPRHNGRPNSTSRHTGLNLDCKWKFESVALAVQHGWPCLLVGDKSALLSTMVNRVADLSGATITEYQMGPDTDIADLIGAYEQSDWRRSLLETCEKLKTIVSETLWMKLAANSMSNEQVAILDDVLLLLESGNSVDIDSFLKQLHNLRHISSSLELDICIANLVKLVAKQDTHAEAKFQWFDGILVQALQKGEWLVLKDANLCSSAVLDRLNALLEPGGYLAINENQVADTAMRNIMPHPQFRLFLTIDPRYGELSRAMRNRCVEIFFPNLDDVQGSTSADLSPESLVSRFSPIFNIEWQSLKSTSVEELVFLCIDHLSPFDLRLAENVFCTASLTLMGMPEITKQMIMQLASRFFLAIGPGSVMHSRLLQYRNLLKSSLNLSTELCNSQPIHAHNNQPLFDSLSARNLSVLSDWLANLLELSICVTSMQSQNQVIIDGIPRKEQKQLSRLERSILAQSFQNYARDHTSQTFPFLESMISSCDVWISMAQPPAGDENDHLTQIKATMHFMRDLRDITNEVPFNDSLFNVYLRIGRALVVELRAHEYTSPVGDSLSRSLAFYNDRWALTTGMSMDRLWEIYRPTTPINPEHDSQLKHIEDIARRLDQLSLRGPFDDKAVLYIRHLVREAHQKVLHNPSVLQDLDMQIGANLASLNGKPDIESQGLLEISNETTSLQHPKAKPHYSEVFDGICQSIALFTSASIPPTYEVLSERPTLGLFASQEISKGSGLFARINSIMYTDSRDTLPVPIARTLPTLLMIENQSSSNISLRNLQLLEYEVEVISQGMTNICQLSNQSPKVNLLGLLGDFSHDIHAAHRDLFEEVSLDRILTRLTDLASITLDSSQDLEPPQIRLEKSSERDPEGHTGFKAIYQTYLAPSLKSMNQIHMDGSKSLWYLAEAWIGHFLGALLLYLPDKPYDPALRSTVDNDRASKRRQELINRLDAFKTFEKVLVVPSLGRRRQKLHKDLHDLEQRPENASVYRATDADPAEVQTKFSIIIDTIIRPMQDVLQPTISGKTWAESLSYSTVELLMANLHKALSRLFVVHSTFADIVKPTIGLLHGLRLGLILWSDLIRKGDTERSDLQILAKLTPFVSLERANLKNLALSDIIPSATAATDCRAEYLKLCILEHNATATPTNEVRLNILQVFNSFYEDWQRKLATDQQAEAAKSSLYRYQGEDAEDEVNEADLLELFPDPDLDPQSPTIDNASNAIISEQALASLHQRLMMATAANATDVTNLILENSLSISELWTAKSSRGQSPLPPNDMLAGAILSLRNTRAALSHTSRATGLEYNFYSDPNMTEAQQLIVICKKIEARFQEIHVAWMEHAIPMEVLQLIDDVLNFRHVEPLAKLLTKAEQLHKFVYEWQVVASREYSAQTLYDELTNLLISWRRIELSTWARMLDTEERKCAQDSASWWYVAYEILIAAPIAIIEENSAPIQPYAQELSSNLYDFLINTLLGQYTYRLNLLRQFVPHIDMLLAEYPAMEIVRKILLNHIYYFAKFEAQVLKSISEVRAQLKKDMDEVILLASWKDTNITALRESAKRSHVRLFKVIRKFRAAISRSSESVVRQGLSQQEYTKSPMSIEISYKLENVAAALRYVETSIQDWPSKPKRFSQPEQIANRIAQLDVLVQDVSRLSTYLSGFSSNLVNDMKELRIATPSLLTKENKATIQHLKSQKRNLLAKTLKSLRMMGIRSNIGTESLAQQQSMHVIFTNNPASRELPSEALAGEHNFLRYLELISTVRTAVGAHNSDIGSRETDRCMGSLEGMLALLLKQRKHLKSAQQASQNLQVTVQTLEAISQVGHDGLSLSQLDKPVTTLDQLRWLTLLSSAAKSIVMAYDEVGNSYSTSILESLDKWDSRFDELICEFERQSPLPHGLVSQRDIVLSSMSHKAVEDFAAEMGILLVANPPLTFVLEQLRQWALQTKPTENRLGKMHIAIDGRFEDSLFGVVDLLLIGIQKYEQSLSHLPSYPEDPQWLSQICSRMNDCAQGLNISNTAKSLETILSAIYAPDNMDQYPLRLRVALSIIMTPLFTQYLRITRLHLKSYSHIYNELCNLAQILGASCKELFMQGFCGPQEASEKDQGASDKLEEGTGLGEGEGAQDISKDVEDDEDLSELAQQHEQGQKDNELEDEPDAVDMQHDELEGELDDGAESENQEEDFGDENVSDEDVEDEVGDTGGHDQSAVDKKRWDGEKDEEKKQEEGEGKGMDDRRDEMAAGNDETSPDQEKEGNQDTEERESENEKESAQTQEKVEKTDPNVAEGENLDLPEDMDLDADIHEKSSSEDGLENLSDSDMESVYDHNEAAIEENEADMEDFGEDQHADQDPNHSENGNVESQDSNQDGNEAGSVADTNPSDIEDQNEPTESSGDTLLPASEDVTMNDEGIAETGAGAQEMTDSTAKPSIGVTDNSDLIPEADENDSKETSNNDNHTSGPTEQQTNGTQGAAGTQSSHPSSAEIHETLKQLGDALEQWRRQRNQIHDAPKQEESNQMEGPEIGEDAELEHLPDANARADTQALGAATAEEAAAFDQRALDTEVTDANQDQVSETDEAQAETEAEKFVEDAVDMSLDNKDRTGSERPGVVLITSKRTETQPEPHTNGQPSEANLDKLDNDFSVIHLSKEEAEENQLQSLDGARNLWNQYEAATRILSLSLTEQLRLILAPTLATRMRGDFRSGKRLNIKRIIPYIASHYKRDKIWMRRSVPSKRAYQIMLAIDDSKSMGSSGKSRARNSHLAFETLALVSKSLSMLEVGELCIVSFGEEIRVVHDFSQTFSSEAGVEVIRHFGFQQDITNVKNLVSKSIQLFQDARARALHSAADLWQLQIIISDGVCEDHEGIQRLVRQAQEERIMIIFIIVDGMHEESILDMKRAVFAEDSTTGGPGGVTLKRYLEGFPFGYYLIVGDVKDLPGVLAAALRQWFAEVAGS
ncbi:hypothetical protein MMC25_004250 [Agyrium rufum]|nr:hypothetical protein [Agyrium rufum]